MLVCEQIWDQAWVVMDPRGKSDVEKRSSCNFGTKYLESLPPFMLLSQFPLVHSLSISFVQKLVDSSISCPKELLASKASANTGFMILSGGKCRP